MTKLKPLKLHEIIGTSTEWTDELWDEALRYLLERTGTFQVLFMVQVLPNYEALPDYLHKFDFLREFRNYPPTLLLGAFDLMRARWPGRRRSDAILTNL
ncbi:hypothetical protein FKR81_37770 [Lentzea tibetensis]|uniref:Uncharacterized protein n=1 Tax=Lentzea tibetensis TaxID=2591470 RepID=A0A563EH73_9PSEU|nr:hypothetical protein [Lentzea tibetensis]TWP45973.1 hypothetical protein FKR81_37770 [Lentzea tibetensis]